MTDSIGPMTTLRETLTAPATKPAVVADLGSLIEDEIAGMKGLSGVAVKTAVKAAKAGKPDIVQRGSNAYLGTLADTLDPFWSRFTESGGGDFGSFLQTNEAQVKEAFLTTAEQEVSGGREKAMFEKFKPQVISVVMGALPKIGALVQKYAG